MKKLLILGGGEMQVPVIEKANQLGYQTIVTDRSETAPGLRIATVSVILDTSDKEGTLKIAQKYKIDGILTTSDYPVNTVAFVAEKIGLPGLSIEAANISTNKYLQRKITNENNLRAPQFVLVKSMKDALDSVAGFNLPLIVKPIDSSASRGVSKIKHFSELDDAFSEAVENSKSEYIIIEEFVEGREFSVESLTQKGKTEVIAITEKFILKNDHYFVEEKHIIPADVTEAEKGMIIAFVKGLVNLFNIDNSATHTEIKLYNNECILIELGARLGGDFIASDLVPLSTGIDMLKNIIYIALDKEIEVEVGVSKYAGIQFIHKFNYSQCQFFLGKEDFIIKKEVKTYNDAPVRSSLDRLGFFIVQDTNRQDLEKKLNLKKI